MATLLLMFRFSKEIVFFLDQIFFFTDQIKNLLSKIDICAKFQPNWKKKEDKEV